MPTLTEQLNARREYIDKCQVTDIRKRFKVGDRVRYRRLVGTIDMIVIDGGANMYNVRFDEGGRWSYRSVDLYHIKVQA